VEELQKLLHSCSSLSLSSTLRRRIIISGESLLFKAARYGNLCFKLSWRPRQTVWNGATGQPGDTRPQEGAQKEEGLKGAPAARLWRVSLAGWLAQLMDCSRPANETQIDLAWPPLPHLPHLQASFAPSLPPPISSGAPLADHRPSRGHSGAFSPRQEQWPPL